MKEIAVLVQNNLPLLQAYKQQANAASQNINLAKNAFAPDATVGYQANYSTYNNITGMNYTGLMMPITGPLSVNNNTDFVPGTALTLLVKWEPVTFGQRNAVIQKATVQFQLSNASYNQVLFKQQYAALYTYLDAVYLEQLLISTQANINRVETSLNKSLVLAKDGLRPGIATTQEKKFVVREKNSKAEWVDVRQGITLDNGIEIFGNLSINDTLVARATDERKQGSSAFWKPNPAGQ